MKIEGGLSKPTGELETFLASPVAPYENWRFPNSGGPNIDPK